MRRLGTALLAIALALAPTGCGDDGYANLVEDTGLSDAWTVLRGDDPGLTCCWNRDLVSGAYQTRIDVVFTAAGVRPTGARKVNETERTPGGLAPSDHGGVVVELTTAP